MKINPDRPLEDLVGDNRGIVRMRLGNVHVARSYLHAARESRPRNMRLMPVALRRGWAKCVLETWNEYRGTYNAVMKTGLKLR